MKPIFEKINRPEDQSYYLEEVNKPYFTDLWHFHPEVEILYVREGFGIRYVGDSIKTFYPGDVVTVGSDTPHVWSCNSDYLNPENKLMTRAICIQFMNDFMRKSTPDIPELQIINEFLNEARRGIQFMKRTGKILINQIEKLPSLTGMKRLLGLLTILDIMSTSTDKKFLSSPDYSPRIVNSEDKARMETIFQYVVQKYPDKIFLEEIASLVNLTPPSFCRYFKSRTTKVFSTFVNEVRIGNSCKMLIENKFSISQVCFTSGFNYLSNFNRQFKKIKGLTPSEFQHQYKNHNFDLMFGD
jgi:AraC-like DNA-binding protein